MKSDIYILIPSRIVSKGYYSEKDAASAIKDVLEALKVRLHFQFKGAIRPNFQVLSSLLISQYLHEYNIVHRDLKVTKSFMYIFLLLKDLFCILLIFFVSARKPAAVNHVRRRNRQTWFETISCFSKFLQIFLVILKILAIRS